MIVAHFVDPVATLPQRVCRFYGIAKFVKDVPVAESVCVSIDHAPNHMATIFVVAKT
jgi:hypothetical protein